VPFLVDAIDRPGAAELRNKLRPDHLGYIGSRVRLVLAAGAKLDNDGVTVIGSFFILDVGERDQAQGFADNDPYTLGGLFEKVTITEWRKTFFNHESCPPG